MCLCVAAVADMVTWVARSETTDSKKKGRKSNLLTVQNVIKSREWSLSIFLSWFLAKLWKTSRKFRENRKILANSWYRFKLFRNLSPTLTFTATCFDVFHVRTDKNQQQPERKYINHWTWHDRRHTQNKQTVWDMLCKHLSARVTWILRMNHQRAYPAAKCSFSPPKLRWHLHHAASKIINQNSVNLSGKFKLN